MNLISPSSEILNQIAHPVGPEELNKAETQIIIDDMLALARGEQGNPAKPTMVGLAAPQLGISQRIIILGANAVGQGEAPEFTALINPTIVAVSQGTQLDREGLLLDWQSVRCPATG